MSACVRDTRASATISTEAFKSIFVERKSIPEYSKDHLFFYKNSELHIVDQTDWLKISDIINEKTVIVSDSVNDPGYVSIALTNSAVLLGVQKGYRTFRIIRKKIYACLDPEDREDPLKNGENIIQNKLVSYGSHGAVYHLKHFNVVVKIYEDFGIFAKELAVYELIQKAYPDPEAMGLPVLIGYGNNFLLIPHYSRTLEHNESDEIYQKLAFSIYNLHALGIVHRDVKFSNVMVHGENEKVILLDFGLATWNIMTKHVSWGTSSTHTLWFRAPEVANDRNHNSKHFASDWWAYGVILASIKKMILTPVDNQALLEDLKRLFGEKDYISCPDNPIAEPFLHIDAEKRCTGARYLGLPEITNEIISQRVPFCDNNVEISSSHVVKLHNECQSWTQLFMAISYMEHGVSKDEAYDLAAILSGSTSRKFSVSALFDKIDGCFFRLNTFALLAMKYELKKIASHCFILCLRGNLFPHVDQAAWIENYFFKGINDTYPEIEKHYFKMLPLIRKKIHVKTQAVQSNETKTEED